MISGWNEMKRGNPSIQMRRGNPGIQMRRGNPGIYIFPILVYNS